MFEHLHPSSFGTFLMAKAYAVAMRSRGILASRDAWAAADTVDDDALWEERPLTDLDEVTARRRTEILLSGWPFKDQFPIVDPVSRSDTIAQLAEQMTRGLVSWLDAHKGAARYYMGRGELEKAAQEYRTLVNQLPIIDVQLHLQLAKLLLDLGKTDELKAVLLRSLRVEPTILAYRALGDLALQSNRPRDAVSFYEKTFTFRQSTAEQVENGYLLAVSLSKSGATEKARSQLLRVLALKPDYMPAVQLLGSLPSLP